MSTKNITYTNRESYLNKSEEMLLSFSNEYFYKKRFLLGSGVDIDKLIFYMQINDSLCTTNCEMIKFIDNNIKGKNKANKKRKQKVECPEPKICCND